MSAVVVAFIFAAATLTWGSEEARHVHPLRHVGTNPMLAGNHNPSFTRGPDVTVIEDSGVYQYGSWATEICDGEGVPVIDPAQGMTRPHSSRCPSTTGGQTLDFIVNCDRPSLFATQPAITDCSTVMGAPCQCGACGGQLTFVPADNMCGTTQCSVRLQDDGRKQCIEQTGDVSCTGTCTGLQCMNMMMPCTVMTPFLCPAGCQPEDCSISVTHYFSITVTCVNDPPSFNCPNPVATIQRLKGDTTVEVLDFIRNIKKCATCSPGQVEEDNDRIEFVVGNDNKGLFTVEPHIAWDPLDPTTADLRFNPKPCEVGRAELRITMFDVPPSGIREQAPGFCRVMVEINDRNTPPTFDMGHCPITVDEDQGRYTAPAWASQISKGCTGGSGEESQQDLTMTVSLVNPADAALFTTQPAVDATTGDLTFEVAENMNTFGRNVEFYVQLCDDGELKMGTPPMPTPLCSCNPITSCPTCQVVIRPRNDPPSFTPGGDVLVHEDLCEVAVPPTPLTHSIPWATQINVGAPGEGLTSPNPMLNPEGQRLYFRVTSDNDGIYASGGNPAIDEMGTLSFTLRPNANGVSVVRATLFDTGAPPNEGPTAVFKITVLPLNDKPSFDLDPKATPGPLEVGENAGPLEFDSWLSRVSKGPDDEAGQTLTLRTVVEKPECFKIQPTHDFTSTTSVRLSLEPAADTPGGLDCDSKVTVYVKDDGLSDRCMMVSCASCGDESEVTYTIRVRNVNDPPSFTKGPDIKLQEDSNPLGYTHVGWATMISAGPNEGPPMPQTVVFKLSTSNDALFAMGAQPSIDAASGNLRFTLAPDACGIATVSVVVEDNGSPALSSPPEQFLIEATCCNDPPVFTLGPDLIGTAIPECRTAPECPRQFPSWVTNIRPGPASATDETAQQVQFTLSGFDPNLFEGTAGQPRIDPHGTLTVTPRVGVNTPAPFTVTVTARDDGPVQAGCSSVATQTFLMQITPHNDPPSFVPGANVEVLEDAGMQRIPRWARQITAGPADEASQTLSFTLSVSDPTLFLVQPAVSPATGDLTFTPAADAFGVAEVTAVLDDGQPVNSQATHKFFITIVSVNDQPSFLAPSEIQVLEDRPRYTEQYAVSVTKGALNEAGQKLQYYVSGLTNPDLFSSPPSITPDGILTFDLKRNAWGDSTFTVVARDDGGTSNMGVDTSPPRTTTIKVSAVNDPPSFTPGGDITGVLEDSGARVYTMWATAISPGAPDELGQIVSFTTEPDKPQLFASGPRIDSNGVLSFTPAPDAYGLAKVKVTASDTGPGTGDGRGGGPPDQRTSEVVFVAIDIVPVNDAPSFVLSAAPSIMEDAPATTITRWIEQISAGAANEGGQVLTWRVTPANTALFTEQPTVVHQGGMLNCIGACVGDLQLTVAPDANGETALEVCAFDNGGTLNGGVDRRCLMTTITIRAVDDPPEITVATTEITILEDTPHTTLERWLRNVVPGPRDEWSQQITDVHVQPAAGQQQQLQTLFKSTPSITMWPTGDLALDPVPDAFGTVTVDVVATDTGAAGRNTRRVPVTITIAPVNDPPTFTPGGSVTVTESSGPWSQRWATAIRPGPDNEAAQKVVFELSVADPTLFVSQPSLDPVSGVLSFEPAPAVHGSTTVLVRARDNGGTLNRGTDISPDYVFNVTIRPVNNRPTWIKGSDVTVLEDSGPYRQPFATDISPGAQDEALQKLRFRTTASPPSILVADPVIDTVTGDLSFTPNTNRHGTVTVTAVLEDDGGTSDGGQQTSVEQVFTITVLPVNDPPVISPGPGVVVREDAPRQVVLKWLQGQSPGPFEDDQAVSYRLVSSPAGLFSEQPALSTVTGDLTFTPARDAVGEATVTITAQDNGGTANGGQDTATPATLVITIEPVNDPPVFTAGPNIEVVEDAQPTLIPAWVAGFRPGPTTAVDEQGQAVRFDIIVDNSPLFVSQPAIDNNGDLRFTVAPNANGVAQLRITAVDNGGMANGGIDTSEPRTASITVLPVNDPPTFTPGPASVTVEPMQSGNLPWATDIAGGPIDETQAVRFEVSNDNPSLFTTQPAISPAGVLSFAAAPAGLGTANVTVTAVDTEGARSSRTFFQIVVTTEATAVKAIIRTNATPATFDRQGFANAVCDRLGVPHDRCVVTAVEGHEQGLLVQVDFQPRRPERPHEPSAVELARRFLLASTTRDLDGLGVVRAWPTPALPLPPSPTALRSCSSFTTPELCIAPCVWDAPRGVCMLGGQSGGSGLSVLELAIIIIACLLVVLALAALVYYMLRKRKKRQEEQRLTQKVSSTTATDYDTIGPHHAPTNPIDHFNSTATPPRP